MTATNKTPAKKPAMKLIKGKEAIDAAIKSIQTRGKKLDRDIWVAAVSAIAHHSEHGDYDRINMLIDAMPKGSRVNALREFFTVYSGCDYDSEAKCFKHTKGKAADVDGAMEKSWTEFKPEPGYTPFDAMKEIEKMLKRAAAVDTAKGDKCTKAQAKAITEFAAAMGVVLEAS